MAKIENVERKPFPEDAIKRLGDADKAISAMSPEERHAAFRWMKSKYQADWPNDSY